MNRRDKRKSISPSVKIGLELTAFILVVTAFSLTAVCLSYAEEKINVKVNYVAKLNELAKAGRQE